MTLPIFSLAYFISFFSPSKISDSQSNRFLQSVVEESKCQCTSQTSIVCNQLEMTDTLQK